LVVTSIIDRIWDKEDKIQKFLNKSDLNINTWLSARMLQCAGKQASGIVRGAKRKQEKRLFQINKFKNLGQFKKARKLQEIFNKTKISKPKITDIELELDSRFIKINLENKTSFDGWITLSSIGKRISINIPFKKTKHFNKLYKIGKIKQGIRISKNNITFYFNIKDIDKKNKGKTLGLDIGKINSYSVSDGQKSKLNKHNQDLNTILLKMSKKKRGSRAFKKCESHRKNYINWSINQLNLDGVKILKIEKIKNLRYKKRCSKILSHWTYTEIFDKLESKCEELGVQVIRISPTYTSQRCSCCGWTQKLNRKGKLFKCAKCEFSCDADINGAKNISFELPPIGEKQRLLRNNKNGFYWNANKTGEYSPCCSKN
jgi:putative transposase